MKTGYIKYLAICFCAVALWTACDDKKESDFSFDSPVALADPFILLHGGTYYAYGTASADGIEVYTSPDMKYWKRESQLALHKDDSYGDRLFWAPEVYYSALHERFFMYYTVDEHIAVAVGDSPLGPFVQEIKQPMLSGKAIDSSLFVDDDGQPYLYFTQFNNGSVIWVAKLYSDLSSIDQSSMRECIKVSQSWEVERGTINEAPFVVKHNGVYYLTYSANSYESEYYGIGYATSDSPMGPWQKFEENPVLQLPGDLEGTGHGAIFTDAGGNLKIVYHAHHSHGNYDTRYMYISDVSFTGDTPAVLVISKDYQTPRLTY